MSERIFDEAVAIVEEIVRLPAALLSELEYEGAVGDEYAGAPRTYTDVVVGWTQLTRQVDRGDPFPPELVVAVRQVEEMLGLLTQRITILCDRPGHDRRPLLDLALRWPGAGDEEWHIWDEAAVYTRRSRSRRDEEDVVRGGSGESRAGDDEGEWIIVPSTLIDAFATPDDTLDGLRQPKGVLVASDGTEVRDAYQAFRRTGEWDDTATLKYQRRCRCGAELNTPADKLWLVLDWLSLQGRPAVSVDEVNLLLRRV